MLPQEKSLKLFERAQNYMPGPHSNLRAPARVKPLFIDHGQGAKLWDVDGNEYLDFVCCYGPGILGHGNPEYNQALKNQVDSLIYLSTGDFRTATEVELAEIFLRCVPGAEQVRFCLAGTEAVQLAIRMARAYTNRPRFIRFEGHYHGWLDNVLGGSVDPNPANRPFALRPDKDPMGSEGVFPGSVEESFKLPWNDAEALTRVLETYSDEVAMVLMEPILLNYGCCPPRSGYLEQVRELCTRYGVVLCFDEVQTGFRVGLNSAQGVFGVTPDLSTFGKSLAGGIPLGAVAGKREIMDLLYERRVLGAGTFNGYPIGLAAALANLTILARDDGAIYRKISAVQKKLMDGLKQIATACGVPALIQGPTGVFNFLVVDLDVAYSARDLHGIDWKTQSRFEKQMAENGVLLVRGGRWFVSAAVTEEDVTRALDSAERVMNRLTQL